MPRRAPAVLLFRDDDAGWDDARLLALLDRFAEPRCRSTSR